MPDRTGFFARLLRDRTANTLVIVAASLFPLTALAGASVDMGRMYAVKSRLQQACDAGALAGRKFMKSDGSNTLDQNASTQAQLFFKSNYQGGWIGTSNPVFMPVKTSDQQVSGTASVTVPMTVTKIINASSATVSVSCKARYDISDTDVIFVLDTTGSMACRPEDTDSQCNAYVQANPAVSYSRPNDSYAMPGYSAQNGFGVPETNAGNGSRIKALRQAVKDFYSVVASSVDANTRVRYGFVSYTSIINAGKAIYDVNPAYLVGNSAGETVNYQTRVVTGEYEISSSYADKSNGRTQANCEPASPNTRDPATTSANPYPFRTSDGRATTSKYTWRNGGCYDTSKVTGPVWTYGQYPQNVSQLIKGGNVVDPTHVDGTQTAWDGCIEERQTQSGTTTFNANAYDLDPTLIPTANAATRWRPAWAAIEWARYSYASTAAQNSNDEDFSPYPYGYYYKGLNLGADNQRKSGFYSCGKPIRRLAVMSPSDISGYVDAADFKPLGGTYHDTGMIWGVRLLATNGIFAADNVGRTGQPSPKKVIVFLTDGDMAPSSSIYGQYGIEYYDQRVSGGNNSTSLKDYHNARFLYECAQASQLKIDVWTVAFGPNTTNELTQCASNPAQALFTTTGSGLSSLFQKIAKQVAMLRLDQ
ncbi:TadE/TadG family type IV pilus assembly protein [Sphingomonas sp. Mn802worker]|uniref:TadE/TadG family type IV pilus assembly protein n=1 Tax=Sphingomonas sp. Mn802worker TaxID=629773 RepID=UPI000378D557|nr:TadE/TadG family type IV pilus assembly protein [Sphingomonas sp. Mn802worker]